MGVYVPDQQERALMQMEREEKDNDAAWQTFKSHAVDRLASAISDGESVLSVMDDLSIGYLPFDVLSDEEINEIMLAAYSLHLGVKNE